MSKPALIIHGHFYQPPRENPWTGIVEREPSAAPFHNWNERIDHECYRPNGYARVFDDRGRIERIVNNYELISFNVGPTLMAWLEQRRSDSIRRIADADRRSVALRGHGNAIAQGYNHSILPLCNERDMRTQIRWGLAEFRHRFGRQAESLWLPETACNDAVLGCLIDEGLRYVLLAPNQAARVREGDRWRDVSDGSIDTGKAYRYEHSDGSGRHIAIFFYNAAVSRGVAFDGLLHASSNLLDRVERERGAGLVNVATDGESYGHHFRHGERCLAHGLSVEAQRRGWRVTNYGAWLDDNPAEQRVEIALGDDGLGSSWSCAHGVGRWFRDCGCHTGGAAGWDQAWRTPLRQALDRLRDEAAALFESEVGDEAWSLRDRYIDAVLDANVRAQLEPRTLMLLEMQRCSMLMYTSCGWFFSDLAGIETRQVMRYAGRLADQLEQLGAPSPRHALLEGLAEARSNEGDHGADLFRKHVDTARTTTASIAAHVMACQLARLSEPEGTVAGHRYAIANVRDERHGRVRLATADIELTNELTRSVQTWLSAAIHLGSVDLRCTVATEVQRLDEVWEIFRRGSLLGLVAALQRAYGGGEFGLEAVLPTHRDALVARLFAAERARFHAQLDNMYETHRAHVEMLIDADLPIPSELVVAASMVLGERFGSAIECVPRGRWDEVAFADAIEIAETARRIGCDLKRDAAQKRFEMMLDGLIHRLCAGAVEVEKTGGAATDAATKLLQVAERLGLKLDLSRAQERVVAAAADGCKLGAVHAPLLAALSLKPTHDAQ